MLYQAAYNTSPCARLKPMCTIHHHVILCSPRYIIMLYHVVHHVIPCNLQYITMCPYVQYIIMFYHAPTIHHHVIPCSLQYITMCKAESHVYNTSSCYTMQHTIHHHVQGWIPCVQYITMLYHVAYNTSPCARLNPMYIIMLYHVAHSASQWYSMQPTIHHQIIPCSRFTLWSGLILYL